MKRVLFLTLMSVVLMSCSKDDDGITEDPKGIDYLFKYEVNNVDRITIEITIFEYNNQGERIGYNTLSNCKKGDNKKFTSKIGAEKLKIQMKAIADDNVSSFFWVQQVYYLDKGKSNNITLTGDDMLGKNEP